jgi:MotA/TolQ/ExbB proton channel family
MNSTMNRWLVSGTWLFAVIAVISASTKGAIGIGAMWAMPAAIGVTLAAMGWPDKQMSRVIAAMGVVWQIALIGAYWPFAATEDPTNVAGPMKWSSHSIVILVVLLVLAMCFAALYVAPAVGLIGKIRKAARSLLQPTPDTLDDVALAFSTDPPLTALWQEYLGQVRPAGDGEGTAAASSITSARDVFDSMTVSHTRLRLDFFRNLPGVFTGIGIIGTFSGLITGLRAFQISQDPAVVQRSLESLLTGVWGAFLISALAIALAIVVTVIEKIVSSALSHHLDVFATGLDGLFPPRPQTESESWMPRLVEALSTLAARPAATQMPAHMAGQMLSQGPANEAAEPLAAQGFRPMVPMSMSPTAPSAANAGASFEPPSMELSSHMIDIAQSTRAATLALNEMAGRMPDLLAQTLQGSNQSHQQASQVMKTLATRLEGVASGIEFSARKTLETVASRLMQSEMNMVSRHHAVADHLGELVQRIEALCGLLQQDRSDSSRGNGNGNGFSGEYGGDDPTAFASPGYGSRDDMGGAYRVGQPSRGGYPPAHNAYAPQRDRGMESNGYGQMGGDDPWQEPEPETGGFGR